MPRGRKPVDTTKRDCFCPRARHVHGTPQAYGRCGCRCEPCRSAHRAIHGRGNPRTQKRWHLLKSRGIPVVVDLDPVRQRLVELAAEGWNTSSVAAMLNLPKSTVYNIVEGINARTHTEVAEAILTVDPVEAWQRIPGNELIPAAGTQRRLQALLAIGWPHRVITERINAETEPDGPVIRSGVVLHRAGPTVTARTARAVKAVYDELCMTPGPSTVTVTRARKAGYVPPLGWEDDRNIDNPAAVPAVTVIHQPVPRGQRTEHERAKRRRNALLFDEIAVERILAGRMDLPWYGWHPDRLEVFRRLFAEGLTDSQAVTRLGGKVSAAGTARARERLTELAPVRAKENAA